MNVGAEGAPAGEGQDDLGDAVGDQARTVRPAVIAISASEAAGGRRTARRR